MIFPYYLNDDGNSTLINSKDYAEKFPKTWKYLEYCKKRLIARNKGKMTGHNWYGYVYKKNHSRIGGLKLLAPAIAAEATFAPDYQGDFFFVGSGGGGGGGYGIRIHDEISFSYSYLLGLLNSKVSTFFLKKISTPFRGGYFALNKQYIERLPIRTINFDDPADVARHDQIVSLVDQMLELNKKLAESKMPQTTEMLKRQIESTDRQIDQLVYKLYDLTDEEIKIVESET